MGLTQKPIVNILVGDFNASDRYHQKTACVCQPQPKSRSKHRVPSSLVWDTKHLQQTWASQQPAQEESRGARAESKYVLWLHTCVSRDFWKFHSFLEKNPKIGNKSSLAGNFTFMARKVITKKGWLYSNVRYFRDLSCFCLSCPLFLRLTRRWLVVCLPPLLRQLLIPPPTGGHISKPSRLAYNIQAAFLKKRRIICSRHLYLLSRHVQQQRTRL